VVIPSPTAPLDSVEATVAGIPAVEEPALFKLGTTSLPGDVFEPIEVTGMLESAGITVTFLPQLPDAATPAAILFADNTTSGSEPGDDDFGWLHTQQSPPAAEPEPETEVKAKTAAPVVAAGPAGLPKRIPKGQLPALERGQQPPPVPTRDAARARGFISNFQTGIRQGEKRERET
jgi:hypothetical protein